MQKAAFSVYILLAIGCLVCLQSADHLSGIALTPCPATITIIKPADNKNILWVLTTGACKIGRVYTINTGSGSAAPANTSTIYCNAGRVWADNGLMKKQFILF